MTIKNALSVLGLSIGASPEKLKSAYRAKALKTHPDKGGSKKTFIKVKTAYDFLVKMGTGTVQEYTLADFRRRLGDIRKQTMLPMDIIKKLVRQVYKEAVAQGLTHDELMAEMADEAAEANKIKIKTYQGRHQGFTATEVAFRQQAQRQAHSVQFRTSFFGGVRTQTNNSFWSTQA